MLVDEQFSLQLVGGVGEGIAPGKPMSPAFADKFADESRQRASREMASNLFIGLTPKL